jgi:hypothetical protein
VPSRTTYPQEIPPSHPQLSLKSTHRLLEVILLARFDLRRRRSPTQRVVSNRISSAKRTCNSHFMRRNGNRYTWSPIATISKPRRPSSARRHSERTDRQWEQPRVVYALPWIAGRHAGGPNFDPLTRSSKLRNFSQGDRRKIENQLNPAEAEAGGVWLFNPGTPVARLRGSCTRRPCPEVTRDPQSTRSRMKGRRFSGRRRLTRPGNT